MKLGNFDVFNPLLLDSVYDLNHPIWTVKIILEHQLRRKKVSKIKWLKRKQTCYLVFYC